MRITLVGYMGSGKSAVGKALAKSLELPYIDLDQRIENAANASVTELILDQGELFFRNLEHQQLLQALGEESFVLSTGGGTPCYYDNMDLIGKRSVSIYLRYSVQDLYDRLEGHQFDRPLIAHLEGEALREYIGKHLFERSVFYEKATISINCHGKSLEEILKEIIDSIHE